MEEYIIITLGFILLAIGLVSSVIPPLPGPPIAFSSLLLLHFGTSNHPTSNAMHFHPNHPINNWILLIMGIVAIASTFLDNLASIYGTKKFGGTKAGVRGSFIGLIIAVFFTGWIPFIGPFTSILVGPFIGAVIGEKIGGQANEVALKSGFGSFLGIKIGVSLVFLVYFFKLVIFG